jgi:hypothetical protein
MGSSDRRRSQRTSGGKVDETEVPLLLKIQPITVPLTFTCMIAEPLPRWPRSGAVHPSLAATRNLPWSAELNPDFCSNGRLFPNVRGKPDDASFGLPDRASTCTM